MTKQKSTKRALLMSALSLLMCVSMLIGSTFAWFTDSVTSAGNIIKSGTLDVAMYWAEGTEDPSTATWTDASTGAIFDYALWEPGYAEVRHIKIANEGSLALKYQINIIANGAVSDLSDVIDVYYVDPAVQVSDRALLTDTYKLGTLTEVLDSISTTAAGNLLAGENHTITLALKMQESAGNEYQDLSIGSDFSVQLLATQLASESDSFDDQYDANLGFLEEGLILVEENGVQYVYDGANNDVIFYTVTGDFTGTTLTLPSNVTTVGAYALANNTSIEEVTINEGCTVIKNRAFRKATALESVDIASTVTTIEEGAFQQSAITEIVIPENVTYLGKQSIGYCSTLEKIVINAKNVTIGNYVARGCASLTEVYIYSDSVTFESGSMYFTNAENGNASAITFYVSSQTVADALYNASTSSHGYGMLIKSIDGSTTYYNTIP